MATKNIGNVAFKLSANTSKFSKGMRRAQTRTQKFKEGAKKAGIAAAALGAAMVVAGRKAVRAAMVQEAAEKKLAASLRVVGVRSQAASYEIRKFASEIQEATTIGDEQVLSLAAMGAAMGKLSGENLKRATTAAIGLSKAFGIELVASMRLVARAAVGDTAQLKRYGIMVDQASSKSEQFNQVLKIGEQNFALARAELETYTGKFQQIGNLWGDMWEKLGDRILEFGARTKGIKKVLEDLNFAFSGVDIPGFTHTDFSGDAAQRVEQMRAAYDKLSTEQQRLQRIYNAGPFSKTRKKASGEPVMGTVMEQARWARAGVGMNVIGEQMADLRQMMITVKQMGTSGMGLPTIDKGDPNRGLAKIVAAGTGILDKLKAGWDTVQKATGKAKLAAEQYYMKLRSGRHTQLVERLRELRAMQAGPSMGSIGSPAAVRAGTPGVTSAVFASRRMSVMETLTREDIAIQEEIRDVLKDIRDVTGLDL